MTVAEREAALGETLKEVLWWDNKTYEFPVVSIDRNENGECVNLFARRIGGEDGITTSSFITDGDDGAALGTGVHGLIAFVQQERMGLLT